MTRLVLCRHAEAGNREQARDLAEALLSCPFAAVYTSPLARALETARAVAEVHRLTPLEVDDLREIDFGDVEGLGFDDLPRELRSGLLQEPTKVRFPGGETFDELRERVCEAIDRIVANHRSETVGVVTHAGSIRAALAEWLRMADDAIFRIDQRHAAVNVVDWLDGVPLVRLVNGTRPSGRIAGGALRRPMRA
jgi:broad specificity phosphatase PhoE